MEEKFLYHIWDEGHLQAPLTTINGKNLKIIYQGQFNTGRGPDFKNAILELNGEYLKGDVEIHKLTNDWQQHNHQEDVHYNNVILHVVLHHNGAYPVTLKEDGNWVEILELEKQLSDEIEKLLQTHHSPLTRSSYCDLLSATDNDHFISILNAAGMRRFKAKIKRFNAGLGLSSFDQILYEGIFEALGYDKNKLNTLQLAQSLPIARLKEFKADGMSKEQLCAILLCSSGLFARCQKSLPMDVQQSISRLYEEQPWHGNQYNIDWQLFRIRPNNHPLKRIMYISDLLWECLDTGLFAMFHRVMQPSISPPQRYKLFTQIWQKSDILGGVNAIGAGVINNIYLNIMLPVMALWAEKTANDQELEAIYAAYRAFPALQENYITRFMSRYMNEAQIKIANSKSNYQQGLMDIYHRFCNWHYCQECLNMGKGNQC